MRYEIKKGGRSLIEAGIKLTGSLSSLIVILIVIFLFKEGLGLFGNSTVENGYLIAVHRDNPLSSLNSEQILGIFGGVP